MAARPRAATRQRTVNGRLQQAILPAPPPASEVNGMRVAVRYEGADQNLTGVGGDWYLSDPLPGGDLLLAVGDVTGHGLAVAATMVKLRYTMAALAVAGHGPSEVLGALNRHLCRYDTGEAATAVIATYRPGTGQLTWARAGHPPMLLLARRERIEPLWQPAGVILGMVPETTYANATCRLHAGDLLLMYTDGFVEEPGGSIDEGVSTLAAEARGVYDGAPADRPAAVVDRLRRRNPRDDACVLAAERLC